MTESHSSTLAQSEGDREKAIEISESGSATAETGNVLAATGASATPGVSSSIDESFPTGTPPQTDEDRERVRTQSSAEKSDLPVFPGYRVIRQLGKGTYGRVWLAEAPKTRRLYAIKEFSNVWQVERTVIEAEVHQLGHLGNTPGIVGIEDANLEADPPFFIMKYCDGNPLNEEVQERGIPTERALEIFSNVVASMDYVHSSGVIHCDLKPANILLDKLGVPWVIDFGQARHLSRGPEKVTLGTLFYMAPDQLSGNSTFGDTRWDVYSLGATFYFLLTGRPPHKDPEIIRKLDSQESLREQLAVYREHLESSPLPEDHRRIPGVDPLLADIVDRCLEKEPKNRYSSAGHIREALERRERKLESRRSAFPRDRAEVEPTFVPLPAGPLPVHQAVEAFRLAARALSEPHNRGIAHGHLKIEHLLFHRREKCVIGDWPDALPDPTFSGSTPSEAAPSDATACDATLLAAPPPTPAPTAAEPASPAEPSFADTLDSFRRGFSNSLSPPDETPAPADVPIASDSKTATGVALAASENIDPSLAAELRPEAERSAFGRFRNWVVRVWMESARAIRDVKISAFPRQELRISESRAPASNGPSGPTSPGSSTGPTSPAEDVRALGRILREWLLGPPGSAHRATPYKATIFGREAFHYLEVPTRDGHCKYRPIDIHLWSVLESCLSPESSQLCNSADDVARMLQVRDARLRQSRVLGGFLLCCLGGLAVFCLVLGAFLWFAIGESRRAMHAPLQESAEVAASFFARRVETHLDQTARFVRARAENPKLHALLAETSDAADRIRPDVADAKARNELDDRGGRLQALLQDELIVDVADGKNPGERFNKKLCLKYMIILDARGRILAGVCPSLPDAGLQEVKYTKDFSGREYFNGNEDDFEHINKEFAFGADGTLIPGPYRPLNRTHVSRPFGSRAKDEAMVFCISTPIVKEGRTLGVLMVNWYPESFHQKMNEQGIDRITAQQIGRPAFAIFAPGTRSQPYDNYIYHSNDCAGPEAHSRINEAAQGDRWNQPKLWHQIRFSENDDKFAEDSMDGEKHLFAVKEIRLKSATEPVREAVRGAEPDQVPELGEGDAVWKVVVLLPSARVEEGIEGVKCMLWRLYMLAVIVFFAGLVTAFVYFGARLRNEEKSLYA